MTGLVIGSSYIYGLDDLERSMLMFVSFFLCPAGGGPALALESAGLFMLRIRDIPHLFWLLRLSVLSTSGAPLLFVT